MLIPDYQDNKYQDFRYSDELSKSRKNLQFCWSQTSYTNSADKILKPIFGDTEYGCAWYGSAVQGCMKLLWLTEIHSTTQVGEGVAKVNVEDVSTAGVAAEGAASAADDEVPAAVDEPSIPSPPPPTQPPPPSQDIPSTSQDKIAQALEITKLKQRVKKLERRNKLKASKLRRLKKVGTSQKVETSDDTVMDDVSTQGRIIIDMDANKDVTLKDVAAVAKDVQEAKIEESLDVQGRQVESQVQIYQINLEHADNVLSIASKRRKGVVIRDPVETATPSIIIHTKAKSKDKGKGILVEEPKPLRNQAQIEQDEAYARELEAELNKNIDWDTVIDNV
nr:hypothetical protein [Tanacetum cinerariifolium]